MIDSYRIRFAVVLAALSLFFSIAWSAQELQLPTRLSDDAFWQLVTDFSEPGGRFPSDNFVSNELRTQSVLADLRQDRKGAGAYIGVGPEQNFTYIVALEPKIAFIIDLRRQNLIEHLMYKALFELSADRAEFLSRLFSRPRPQDLGKDSSVVALFDAFRLVEPDPGLFAENLGAIKERLIDHHQFTLTAEDESSLIYILRAFYIGGQTLTYSGPSQLLRPGLNRIMPAYETLMTDTDEYGAHHSYLASEEKYLTLQQLQKNNLIVPLVGNFAGPTAIRSVGRYLKEHATNVSAFYTSNVEQYLFMNSEEWRSFYANVAALPLDSKSVFIRPLINTGLGYDASPVFRVGFQWDTVLFPIHELVEAFNAGLIETYYDVIQ